MSLRSQIRVREDAVTLQKATAAHSLTLQDVMRTAITMMREAITVMTHRLALQDDVQSARQNHLLRDENRRLKPKDDFGYVRRVLV